MRGTEGALQEVGVANNTLLAKHRVKQIKHSFIAI